MLFSIPAIKIGLILKFNLDSYELRRRGSIQSENTTDLYSITRVRSTSHLPEATIIILNELVVSEFALTVFRYFGVWEPFLV